MEKNRSRMFARVGAVAAIALVSLAGCGGGGFDKGDFADDLAKDGMTKDQAECTANYIDDKASDDAKKELGKMMDEGDDYSGSTDDDAAATEIAGLLLAAAGECVEVGSGG